MAPLIYHKLIRVGGKFRLVAGIIFLGTSQLTYLARLRADFLASGQHSDPACLSWPSDNGVFPHSS